jgi:L-seryl-tRNA(Ser) seleniumtransferase
VQHTRADLHPRAAAWVGALRAAGLDTKLEADEGFTGGGSLPGEGLPTWVAAVVARDADAAMARLRRGEPAVVARVADGKIKLDPRTVLPEEDAGLLAAVIAALT